MRRGRIWRRICAVLMMLVVLANGLVVCAEETPTYKIRVNRATNYVAVYSQDELGEYNIPVIEFVCSTGKNNKTPVATTKTTNQYELRPMNGKVFAQYATRFNGKCLFHGVPITGTNKDSLKTNYYNQLGEQASAGCVRLTTADAKWIYDYCPSGTIVEVFDDPNDYGPFGKPAAPKIPDGHPYAKWDPTDPDPNNPWISERPVVQLIANTIDGTMVYLPKKSDINALYDSIGLFTAQGEAYATDDYNLSIYGDYDLNAPGFYTLYLRGYDSATTLRGDAEVTLVVY